jgi:hypothetical protein
MLAELTFVGVGLVIGALYMPAVPSIFASAVAAVLVAALLSAGLLMWQRHGLLAPLITLSRRWGIFTAFLDKHEGVLRSTDSLLREFVGAHRNLFGLSWFSFFCGWAAGAVEVWIFLRVLSIPVDALLALLIQVWLIIVNRLTAFVPGNVGTAEAGAVMVFSYLQLSPEGALAFALLRRVRQMFSIVAGLGILAVSTRSKRWQVGTKRME